MKRSPRRRAPSQPVELRPVQQPRSAREVVFNTLLTAARTDRFVTDLLDAAITQLNSETRNQISRSLCLEMVSGITRRRATLDAVIAHVSNRRIDQVENELWLLMRMGAYELMFLGGSARHAVLNETVELARRVGRPRWTGILNGVLRGMTRLLTEESCSEPARNNYPVASAYRVIRDPVFVDPESEPVEYFAQAFSFPTDLSDQWHQQWAAPVVREIGRQLNQPPGLTLRTNTLKTTRDELLRQFAAADISAGPGATEVSIYVAGEAAPARLVGFDEGLFTIQDESAIRAGLRLDPQPGSLVLDLGAAPGTKTTHLAELMGNEGGIVAADVSEKRLRRIDENCQRLGIGIVTTRLVDRVSPSIEGSFDAVLIDVPCSNTGVLGKRPEARWRYSAQSIAELSRIQAGLLRLAMQHVHPGSRILYSTCSIDSRENEDIVAAALVEHPGFRLIDQQLFLPGPNQDGAFQALLDVVSV